MQPDAEPPPAAARPPLRRRLARWLVTRWYGHGPVLALVPLAVLFRLVTLIRHALFRAGWLRSAGLPVPVLVVGNLVAGGAGKTPTVIALVEGLRARGWKPGVLSRGYGGQQQAVTLVHAGSLARSCGDEAVLLARRLAVPLAIGRQRVAAGRALLAAHPELDCLVCDDGLQHYALQRDLELVVVDQARGFGNQWPLPAGPLREGIRRLRRVDAVIVHGTAPDARRAARLNASLQFGPAPVTLHLAMRPPRVLPVGPAADWSAWRGRQVHAVAGIGDPERFFAGLRAQGVQVIGHAFPDHHAYDPADLDFADPLPVLLTEKDAVKCAALVTRPLWVVPLDAALPAAFLDQLSKQLESLRGRKTA